MKKNGRSVSFKIREFFLIDEESIQLHLLIR